MQDEPKKRSKTFKEYYQNEEFKQRHLTYLKEKIMCECGRMFSRSNISKHKKLAIHQRRLDKLKPDPDHEILNALQILRKHNFQVPIQNNNEL